MDVGVIIDFTCVVGVNEGDCVVESTRDPQRVPGGSVRGPVRPLPHCIFPSTSLTPRANCQQNYPSKETLTEKGLLNSGSFVE